MNTSKKRTVKKIQKVVVRGKLDKNKLKIYFEPLVLFLTITNQSL